MTDNREKNLKSIVNASGFVFQLSIMDNIQRTIEKHGWEILVSEHPWCNHSNGDEGYIDIVLKKNRDRLVIECKRTKDASWVFINPNDKHDRVNLVRSLWSLSSKISNEQMPSEPAYKINSGWYNFSVKPESPESSFCSIRGSGEKDKPFLERICGQLLKAVDCLLVEEMEIEEKKRKIINFPSIYIPAIVTNAELKLCHFDPKSVSLSDGRLKDADFKTVPFLRFRKSLTTVLSPSASPANINEANIDKQRTILIINSEYLCEVLENIELIKPDVWPWERF